jgi:hypothetical protein
VVGESPGAEPVDSSGFERSEQNTPGPERPPARRDFASATDRHLTDLTSQRDRLESTCLKQADEITRLSVRLTELSAENAHLKEVNRSLSESLDSERFHRGFLGILSTVMTAVGGGLVSVWTDWRRWATGSLLFLGCAFLLYNSIVNLSAEARRYGIWGILKQLWSGRAP